MGRGSFLKIMLWLFFFVFCCLPALADVLVDTAWVRRYNGPGNWHDSPHAMVLDNSSNIYITGRSRNHETDWDYATIKYDSNGNLLWARIFNGPGDSSDWPYAIALDNSGHVYVAGDSYDSITGLDYVTIKYDTSGDQLWVRRYSGTGDYTDQACAIGVDSLGNVYVAGSSYSSTDFDYVTLKYNSDGNLLWIRRYNGPIDSTDQARVMAVDGSGNVYVTGYSLDTLKSGMHIDTTFDYVTVKYNTTGNQLWVRRYNGPGNGDELPFAMAKDGSGNVYVTGKSWGGWLQDCDYATIKYEPGGNQVWVQRYNGGNDWDVATAVATDGSGNVYVTGGSRGAFSDFDYGTIKYYANGDTAWARRYNGIGNYTDYAWGIAVDDSGDVYVTGQSAERAYYPTNNDYVTIKYDSYGNRVWLARYNGPVSNPANNDDEAVALAVDDSGYVYVTGSSEDSLGYYDFVTIKYRETNAIRGDANSDGIIDVGDVVNLINYLYKGGSAPHPLGTGDVNCDGTVDIGDVVYLINYLFKGGPAPGC